MPPKIVQEAVNRFNSGVTTILISPPGETTAGNTIIVRVTITGNTQSVSSVVDDGGGGSYVRAIATSWGSGAFFGRVETWYKQNANATGEVQVDLTGAADIGGSMIEVSGLVTSGVVVAATNEVTSSSSATVRSGTITPSGKLFLVSTISGPFELGGGNPGTPTNNWSDSANFDGTRVGAGGTRQGYYNSEGALEDVRVYSVAQPNGGHVVAFKQQREAHLYDNQRYGRGAGW